MEPCKFKTNCITYANYLMTRNTNNLLDVLYDNESIVKESNDEFRIISPVFTLNASFDAVEWKKEIQLYPGPYSGIRVEIIDENTKKLIGYPPIHLHHAYMCPIFSPRLNIPFVVIASDFYYPSLSYNVTVPRGYSYYEQSSVFSRGPVAMSSVIQLMDKSKRMKVRVELVAQKQHTIHKSISQFHIYGYSKSKEGLQHTRDIGIETPKFFPAIQVFTGRRRSNSPFRIVNAYTHIHRSMFGGMYLFEGDVVNALGIQQCEENNETCSSFSPICQNTERFLLNHDSLLCYTKADTINDAGVYLNESYYDKQSKVECPSKMKVLNNKFFTQVIIYKKWWANHSFTHNVMYLWVDGHVRNENIKLDPLYMNR